MTPSRGSLAARAMRKRWISAPVWSPSAWMMRWWLWPPSMARASWSSLRSKRAPHESQRSSSCGPTPTTCSVTSRWPRPEATRVVSSMWLARVSSLPHTTAMPPWAQLVAVSRRPPLSSTSVSRRSPAAMAADSPATPPPTTSTSVWRRGRCMGSSGAR